MDRVHVDATNEMGAYMLVDFRITIAAITICMSLSTAALADITKKTYFPPNNLHGNVADIQYKFTDANPARYFTSIETAFLFDEINPSPVGTRFVATQFWLDPTNGSGGGDTLYMGINPTARSQGYGGQAHFSYFGSSGGQHGSNCHSGADSGSGITCAINVATVSGDTYRLQARLIESNENYSKLEGWLYVIDATGNEKSKNLIGDFKVLRGNMALTFPQSWIEGSADPCSALVKTSITFTPLTFVSTQGRTYSVPVDTIPKTKCGVWAEPLMKTVVGGKHVLPDIKMTYGN